MQPGRSSRDQTAARFAPETWGGAQPAGSKWTPGKIALVVLAITGVLGICALLALIALLWFASQATEGLSFTLDAPERVRVAEEFTLTVAVRNDLEGRPLQVDDIDFGQDYLDRFTLLGTTPEPSSEPLRVFDMVSFTFDHSVPPLEEARFQFHLRATDAGEFAGEVDVWVGMDFETHIVRTRVEPR